MSAAADPLPAALEAAVRVIPGWLDYQRALHRAPALSLGIIRADTILFLGAFGHADIAAGRKATPATRYRIASISKTFTATAVMQLVERELVRLDERVDRYLPWFRSPGGALGAITVRQLLSHTAGVERDGFDHWATDRFPTLEQLKTRVRDGFAMLPPLERWKYSNLGYAVLGEIVSAASGLRYETYVHERILKPLRLTSTGFALTTDARRALAVGYGRDREGRPRQTFPNPDTNVLRAAAGLISNAADLCAYMAAQFPGSGRLLSDLSKREMQRPHWLRAGGQTHYGLGWEITPTERTAVVGHGGGFQGFRTVIGIDPKRKIGIVVLTNSLDALPQRWMAAAFCTIDDCVAWVTPSGPPWLAPQAQGRSARGRAVDSRRVNLRPYEGRFTSRWNELQVVDVGGRLLAYELSIDRPLLDPWELAYEGPGRFTLTGGPGGGPVGETVTFARGPSGAARGLRWGPSPMAREKRGGRV